MASSARIDELLKKFEENPRRYFAPLANEYRKAGDVDRAIQLCREHLPQQPGHMSGHIVFGQALYEAQQYEESRQVFTAALALDPENLIALRHLGDIARNDGDLVAARDWYQRVLDADPRNDEIGGLLASLDALESAPPASDSAASAEESAEMGDIAPLHLSTGAFSTVADVPPTETQRDAATEPPAPSAPRAADAPATMSAMDFALASIQPETPAARDRGDRDPARAETAFPPLDLDAMESGSPAESAPSPQPASHDESPFDVAYMTGGGATDEMELTPAHGASALVSRAEPEDDATTFRFGNTLGGDDDRAPLELVDEPDAGSQAASPGPAAPEPAAALPAAETPPAAPAPAPRAMDEKPLGLESMEFVPPPRDAEPDPMQGHLLRDEEPAAGTPAAFVTETMAELYLQQGFRDEALSVYRQLLAQSPADENLRDRVAQLESGSRSSVSVAGISDTIIEAARQRQTAPAPKKSAREFFAAIAAWRPASAAARPDSAGHEAADVADVPSPTSANAADGEPAVDEFGFPLHFDSAKSVVHRDLGAPPAAEERRGMDLGAALLGDDPAFESADELPPSAAIEPATLDYAAEEADSATATASADRSELAGFDVVPTEELTGDRYGQSEPANDEGESPFAPAPGVGRLSGPVDSLFGDGAVPSRDEAAASALASAFGGDSGGGGSDAGGTPAFSSRQPTGEVNRTTGAQSAATAARPAGSELSLDHVFRETPRRGAEKRREAPAFSFDQFFSDGASSRGTAESPATPTPSEGVEAGGDQGADIEQFNAWLEGLKKK